MDPIEKFPHEWLKNTLKESYSVPHNINQESTELLLNLKEINDARDSDAGRIISFLQKLNIEYETADDFNKIFLQKLGLTFDTLSSEAQETINDIVSYQQDHDLHNLGASTILLDKVERSVEYVQLCRTKVILEREYFRLLKAVASIKKRTEELNSFMPPKEEIETLLKESQNKSNEIVEFEKKIDQYKLELQEIEIKMKNLIIPNESNYKCVLGKVGEVKCIKEKISSFQKELMQYKKLPPNFSEAREVLANVGKEIQELDKQICDRILNDEDHK